MKKEKLLKLIGELADDDSCDYDHNGWCQTHYKGGAYDCPNHRARKLLAK